MEKRLAEDGLIKPTSIDRNGGKVEFVAKDGNKIGLDLSGSAPIRELKIMMPGRVDENTYKVQGLHLIIIQKMEFLLISNLQARSQGQGPHPKVKIKKIPCKIFREIF